MAERSAEQIAALEAEYARIAATAATTRTQMLSDRLTRSRKETQMREAVIEEAEDQAAYFEGRTREMERIVETDETHLAELEAHAAAIRAQIAEIHVREALAAFDAALRGLVPQLDALQDALAGAAPHLQTAFARRDALPKSATDARDALSAANVRAASAESLLHELRYILAGPHDPDHGAPTTTEGGN